MLYSKRVKKGVPILLLVLVVLTSRDAIYSQGADNSEPNAVVTPSDKTKPNLVLPPDIPPEFSGLAEELTSFYYTNIDVRYLLEILARTGKFNIVATPAVKGSLTVSLEKVTINDALEIALITNGLAKEFKGPIINVMTEQEYFALYGEAYNQRRVVKTFQLKYYPADATKITNNLLKLVDEIRSQGSKVIADAATRTIVLIETPEKIKEIEELIGKLDVPVEEQTFDIKNADLGKIQSIIETQRTPVISDIIVDTRTRKIIVRDTPKNLARLADLIRTFDERHRQVLIEARMIQITLNDEFYMGVEWDKVFSSQSSWNGVELIHTTPINPSQTTITTDKSGNKVTRRTGLEASIGRSGVNLNFDSVVQMLSQYGNTRIISSPRLYTVNGQQATFMVGSKEAYVTTTVTSTQASTTSSETVQFIDVGITLAVTPTINSEGFIKMSIKPEISEIRERISTAQGNEIPILQTTNVLTEVVVKDGVTIVLAGLIRDEEEKKNQGVPILSSIPLLGSLFRSKTDVEIKRETIIFVTPYLMTGEADDTIKTRQRDMMEKMPKDLRPIR